MVLGMTDPTAIPAGIAAQDWANTPESVRALFVAQVAAFGEEIARLTARVATLEERTGKSSRNSSLPPSSDGPRVPARRKRKPSGRKSGGQPGHEGHGRALLPLTQVDEVVEVRPLACAACGTLLLGEDVAPGRHQVTDLPPVRPLRQQGRGVLDYLTSACAAATLGAPAPSLLPLAPPLVLPDRQDLPAAA